MKIIEGSLPQNQSWQVLVLLQPGQELGIAWQLGTALAQANNGKLLAAVIISEESEANVANARQTLAQTIVPGLPNNKLVCPLLVLGLNYQKSLARLVEKTGADLLLTPAEGSLWHDLNRVTCTVAAVRGQSYSHTRDDTEPVFRRILVPTSGGPNIAHALSFLSPLAAKSEITALYVANNARGANEEALGHARLRKTVRFIGVETRIQTKLIKSDSTINGIVDEAAQNYDLIVIGATQESSFDRALFGDIPGAIVRESKKPVVVVRQPKRIAGSLLNMIAWFLRNLLPPLTLADRAQTYVRVRRSTRPNVDYYVLMGLSTAIASLGLMLNSPAVVIGAMLVAPLMSPIVGIGMAVVLGDARFLRLSLGAVMRGVLVALLVSFLSGLLQSNGPLTSEILARTQPNVLDLGVAIFSGLAAAYALCRSEAAAALPGVAIAAALVPPLATIGICFATGNPRLGLGAILLFSTNLVAISSAAVLVFLLLGFLPAPEKKTRQLVQLRSMRTAFVLLSLIAALLAVTTYRVARESATTTKIQNLVRTSVGEIPTAELAEVVIGSLNDPILEIDVIVRSTRTIPYITVVELQRYIATELQRDVALTLTVIPTTRLDPFSPPTQTPVAITPPTATAITTPGGTVTP